LPCNGQKMQTLHYEDFSLWIPMYAIELTIKFEMMIEKPIN